MNRIIRFLETYERVSTIRPNVSGNISSLIGDVIVSAMYSYFHPDNYEEKKENLPSLPFVSVSKISSLEKECPICFDEYTEEHIENKNIVITECGHLFHKKCLEIWLKEKKNCPVCRFEFNIF